MKSRNKKRNLTGLVALGIASASYVPLSGCCSYSDPDLQRACERDMWGILGVGMMGLGVQRDKPELTTMGRGIVDLNAADRQKTEVIINNPPRDEYKNQYKE